MGFPTYFMDVKIFIILPAGRIYLQYYDTLVLLVYTKSDSVPMVVKLIMGTSLKKKLLTLTYIDLEELSILE